MATSEKQPQNASNDPVLTNTEKKAHEGIAGKNIASNPTKRQCKTSRKESEIWNYFEHNGDKINPRAICAFCDKDYAADKSRHGTKTLWNHLMFLCPNSPCREEDPKQRKLSLEPQDGQVSAKLRAVTFSVDDCRKALANMVMVDEKPFRMVEGEGFKNFIKTVQPMFKVPSRVTVSRDCLKLYEEEKLKLKKILKNQRVCLTTDTWTSVQNLNYMCLTAHWIDCDWKLNHKILNFRVVPDHKGDTIGQTIEECLIEWGIGGIFTLTVDNATSNNGVISYLKRKTKDWKGTILDHKYIHLRCCAHIVNLIVRDGLDEHFETIQKIRKAVKYVKSSPKRLSAFKDCVEKEKIQCKSMLCLDVETRWNSTYLMLAHAEKFEKAFERLGDIDRDYQSYFSGADGEIHMGKGKGRVVSQPGEGDWVKARCFVKFLKLFYGVTVRLSGSSYVTSHCFFHELVSIQTCLNEVSKGRDEELKIVAEGMKVKFEKYWENSCNLNLLLYIAVILDPRYNLKYVKFWLEQMYPIDIANTLIRDVKHAMENLYADYSQHQGNNNASADGSGTSKGVNSSSNEGLGSMDVDDEDYSKFVKSQFKRHLMEEECAETKSEIAKYLAEGCDNGDEMSFDILSWWKVNASRYPILSLMAKDVLAMSVSTVPSESAFSTGGRVLDSFRSSLSPKTVEALVCGQNWLRSSNTDYDFRDEIEDAESYDATTKEVATKKPSNGGAIIRIQD